MRNFLPGYQPTEEEIELGKYMQSLFDFPTEVGYLNIGNTGLIYCIIAKGELRPNVIKLGSNYGRDENSILLLTYARNNLPKWFDAGNGFYIYSEDVVELKTNRKHGNKIYIFND